MDDTSGEPLAVRVEPMDAPPAGATLPPGATVLRTFALDVYEYRGESNRAEKDSDTRVVLRSELSEAELAALPRDGNGNPDTSRLVFLRVLPGGGVVEIPTAWVANPNPPPAGWAAAAFVPRSLYLLAVRSPEQRSLRTVPADARYFRQTGYRVNEETFWDYFQRRGGVRTLGYPISREFTLMGFQVQMFQRAILQLMPDGSVATMNLLDGGLMPYERINFSAFPGPDREMIDTAPSAVDPEYARKALEFVAGNVPDEWDGMAVGFLRSFLSTVRYEDAFPRGEGDPALVPLLNLEVWGLPTSRPALDPSNHGFVYQRFQRGVMHYDVATGATQALLLADYLKGIMTGKDLPIDLEEQARGSRFYRQYDPARAVARPRELGGIDLRDAFEPEVPQEAVASALSAVGLPSAALLLAAVLLAKGTRSYSWVQVPTPGMPAVAQAGANTAVATFTAPAAAGTLTFNLTVQGVGGPSTDTVNVTVLPVAPPVANAGPNQQVAQGKLVTLDGQASTGAVSFAWTQIDGPVVVLSGANTATATFTFPSQNTVLTFQLQVTGPGGTATATTQVSAIVDVIGIIKAEYRADTRQWIITGTSSIPGPGNTITIHLGNALTDPTVGTTEVDDLGQWVFRQSGSTAQASVGATIIVESSRGGRSLAFPVRVR